MFDPSSTTQMLSRGSTRTTCANTNPYTPWPISRTNVPFAVNSNKRAPPRVKVLDPPSVAVAVPVRV